MTTARTIDYEALAQDAMRGVVRQVLTQVAKTGLPGDHHFYVSFDTQLPGVSISKRLKEKYSEEMTIVLQHRFWDLSVTEERFEVKLTFDGIPERLVVPFDAIKVFFDPSVRYGLQFEDPDWVQDGPLTAGNSGDRPFSAASGSGAEQSTTAARSAGQRKRPLRKPRLDRIDTVETSQPVQGNGAGSAVEKESVRGAPPPRPAELKPVPAPPPSGAQIVSLSDFRKK